MRHSVCITSELKNITTIYNWIKDDLEILCEKRALDRILLALHEAVTNAVIHGNKQDATKVVTVTFEIFKELLIFKVMDEGSGTVILPTKEEAADIFSLAEGGRGLKLIVQLSEEAASTPGCMLIKLKHHDL